MRFNLMLVAVAIVFAVLAVATSANAQQQFCDTERGLLDALSKNFQEWPVWVGRAGPNKMILTRREDGGWTLVSVVNGRACIAEAGSDSRFDKGM